ncbi:MAG: hypothetical protein ABFR47_07000, partial [Verrucomicrobiota bacterium]
MQLRHRFEYAATATLLGLCRRLPQKGVYTLFHGIGKLTYHLLGRRTRLTLRNLEIAFPDKTRAERKDLAKRCYINLAESMAFNSLMMNGRISNDELLNSVETDGWENVEKAKATGKGLLVFGAHIGNWELMPQYTALRIDTPLHVVARKTDNPLLEEKIVRPLRERFGIVIFYKKKALMRIMKVLKNGGVAGFLIDQKLNPPEGIRVEFFGREAPTTSSLALLQIRFGVVALPAFMVKAENGKYRMVIREPIQWQDNGSPKEEQVAELTRIHQKTIEEIIREYP